MADRHDGVRRFACTACGQCCNRGPEIELGEATSLAGVFITNLLLKVHSLPLATDPRGTVRWWKTQGSTLPARAALDETRRHIGYFSSQDRLDKGQRRTRHLELSALTLDTAIGRCPALVGKLCGIYDNRPLGCRTVPMHYSRPQSVLAHYLDRFVATPQFGCNTAPEAPIVFNRQVVDPAIQRARDDAFAIAQTDRRWKDSLVALMRCPDAAAAHGLPSYEAVLRNADAGSATTVPMRVAWRVARGAGLLSDHDFRAVCLAQLRLIEAELARNPGAAFAEELTEMLADYRDELFDIARHQSNAAGARLGRLARQAGAPS
jgi:Fe-S-cluster containining protein